MEIELSLNQKFEKLCYMGFTQENVSFLQKKISKRLIEIQIYINIFTSINSLIYFKYLNLNLFLG